MKYNSMNNLREYILEKFKIHKNIDLKEELYIFIPYGIDNDFFDYILDKYKKNYYEINYTTIGIKKTLFLTEVEIIDAVKYIKEYYDSTWEIYKIPINYTGLDDDSIAEKLKEKTVDYEKLTYLDFKTKKYDKLEIIDD